MTQEVQQENASSPFILLTAVLRLRPYHVMPQKHKTVWDDAVDPSHTNISPILPEKLIYR
jgi:hypothetical protein